MLASNLENEANNYSLSMSGPIGLSIRLLRNVSNDTPMETNINTIMKTFLKKINYMEWILILIKNLLNF